jgi:Tfp pilus assembly protein PilO
VRGEHPFWRRRLLPAFLALVVLNLVALAGWTVPRTVRLRSATARVEEAREAVERERARVARARERAEAIDANSRDLARFYASVVGTEEADLLPMLVDIEAMARRPGLTPGHRSFQREDLDDVPLERVGIVLPLGGSYQQLVGFLQEVERSPRFLTVDRLSLRGSGQSEATLQVEMSAFMKPTTPGARGNDAR